MKKSCYQGIRKRVIEQKAKEFQKPEKIESKQIEVHHSTEFFPTPKALAEEMTYWVKAEGVKKVLEPSVGNGALIDPIIKNVEDFELHYVEKDQKLFELFSKKCFDYNIKTVGLNGDFLEWETDNRFNLIVMNPPFKKVKAHIKKAVSLLEEGGQLLAIVPCTFKSEEFEDIINFGNDAFQNTKVYTKLVEFVKCQ